jgi:polygalacturonase
MRRLFKWILITFLFVIDVIFASRQTFFNIDDYGADPTGVRDSFPAISTAIQQATKGLFFSIS